VPIAHLRRPGRRTTRRIAFASFALVPLVVACGARTAFELGSGEGTGSSGGGFDTGSGLAGGGEGAGVSVGSGSVTGVGGAATASGVGVGVGGAGASTSSVAVGVGGASTTAVTVGAGGSTGSGPIDCAICAFTNCPEILDCGQDPVCGPGVGCTIFQCVAGGDLDPACAIDCFGGDIGAALEALQILECVVSACGTECLSLLPGG
jgi:hypothetical protein